MFYTKKNSTLFLLFLIPVNSFLVHQEIIIPDNSLKFRELGNYVEYHEDENGNKLIEEIVSPEFVKILLQGRKINFEPGAENYITKPFDTVLIQSAVKRKADNFE